MKRRLTYSLLLASSLLIPVSLPAQADWLDNKDRQFETVFEKTDAAFDKAMSEGVDELDKELSAIWGEARQLPEAKVWVGYSSDRKTRIIVDYDRGEMSLEGLDKEENDLRKAFQDVLLEDSRQLDERAALRRKLIEKTNDFWRDDDVDFKPQQSEGRKSRPRHQWQPAQPAPKSASRPESRVTPIKQELAQLVAPRISPRFIKRNIALPKGKMASLSRLTIPLRKDRDHLSAQALADPIAEAARDYGLKRSLILSVIKNESAFNPRARSHANALGLMQLVPTSGGKEAYSFLMGRSLTPSPEVLYDPIENIRLGTTYLHLLNTRYFGKVKNAKTRQYLIIAAYNTGAGNVAKAFTGKMKLAGAIQKINKMTPAQVFKHLQANLPYAETKTYLARVTRDTKNFANWDNRA